MADVSVRPATEDDLAEIGRIQVQTWQTAYRSLLPPPVIEALDPADAARGWRDAVTAPPSRRHGVLVACEGDWRVGFTAFAPDTDTQPGDPEPEDTASVGVLLVEPRWGRRGHGSRLLAAVVDLLRPEAVTRLVAWIPAADSASMQFYRSAGWEADGRQRSLDTGVGMISELRLHTSLVQPTLLPLV